MNYVGNEPAPAGLILVGDTNPVGTISFFHAPPDASWARLNGQALLKANYPDLWAYAQGFLTADQVANPGLYKSIDAATFAVPKLDGLFIRAAGQLDAERVAAAIGVLQGDAMQQHAHSAVNNDVGVLAPGSGFMQFGTSKGGVLKDPNFATIPRPANENRPANVALVPCVKALRTVLVPMTGEASPYAPGTLAGFTMANNALDAVNDIDVAVGRCRATGDGANIVLDVALTKQLDAVWALGNNAGMRASGTGIADTTYHVFAIKLAGGVVDVAADTSATGANLAANTGAIQWRRIGSIIRLAGTIIGFLQRGDYFMRNVPQADAADASGTTAGVLRTVGVPLGLRVQWLGQCLLAIGASGSALWLSSPDMADFPANSLTYSTINVGGVSNAAMGNAAVDVFTNTAAQIRTRVETSGSPMMRLSTHGWIDRRGRDDV